MIATAAKLSVSVRASRRARTFAFACLAGFVLLLARPVGANPEVKSPETKIAVIDLRRALADTEEGLRVQAKLQQLSDTRQTDFEAKKTAYDEARSEFEKLSKDKKTGDSVLRKKASSLEKMAYELQAAQITYRREIQQQENDLMLPIIKQMLALVRRLAAQNGYDMVLNKEAVPYYRSDLDITDRIIQMFNSSQGVKPAEAPPTKPEPATAPTVKPAPKAGKPSR